MSAKLLSGGSIHPLTNSDRLRQTIFPTTRLLLLRSKLATPIRMLSNKASSRTVNALYMTTQTATSGTLYDLLGIPENGSTQSDIKKAYKKLARKYHPDASPPERTEEYTKMFIMVHEAYVTLSDPRSRAVYDLDLARGVHLSSSSSSKFRRSPASGLGEVESTQEGWKSRWQSQLNELKRRTVFKDPMERVSWGSRMRRQK